MPAKRHSTSAQGCPAVALTCPRSVRTARMLATDHGHKTDETDAHSVTLDGTLMGGLRPVVDDEQLAVHASSTL